MKKRTLEITNWLLLVLLTATDVLLITNTKFRITGGDWVLVVLGLLWFALYLGGKIFPTFTVGVVYKITCFLYKNTPDISLPVFEEAERTFKRRLPYFLVVVNVLMLLLLLTIVLCLLRE